MIEFVEKKIKIAVIGLGYVGCPLAAVFGNEFHVVGFDTDSSRIEELRLGVDRTGELSAEEIGNAHFLEFSDKVEAIAVCNVFIITVPTPIDNHKVPDLRPLEAASVTVGQILKPGDIVIYESTVYPGVTEEVCAPILEQTSGLSYCRTKSAKPKNEFYLGYSPERINPGDKSHKVVDIVKVTSGSTPEVADFVDKLYKTVIAAGTHKAKSIKIAEAAKVIENTQRDVNIALVNELAVLFDKLELDTEAVLEAAGTKWNFLPFRPGLVGGHCIGVDPYYLTYKAQEVGYDPQIILAGRKINDEMAAYSVTRVVQLMAEHDISVIGSKILILGLTFKENCPDTRNSKVYDLIAGFTKDGAKVEVFDPYINKDKISESIKGLLVQNPKAGNYDCIVLAVAHSYFIELGALKIREFGKENHVLFDLKYAFKDLEVDGRL